MTAAERARGILELFAGPWPRRAPRYRWPLWRGEEPAPAPERGRQLTGAWSWPGAEPEPAPKPAARPCVVCGAPCADWRAKTCSVGCHAKRSTL